MRIALTAEGSRGDVHPLLDLGSALVRHGHEVRLCAPPDFRADAEVCGLPFHAIGRPVRPWLAEHAADVVAGGRRAFSAASEFLASTLEHQFRDLPDALGDAELLVGAGVSIAAPSVAERAGIPYRYLVYCPALLPSAEHPPMLFPVAQLRRPLNRVAWWVAEAALNALVRRALNRARSGLGLAPIRDAARHMLGERPLVAADPLLAPVPLDCPLDARSIGCLHAGRVEPLPGKLEQFLAEGEPPVFIGFGSMTDPDPAATTRLLLDAIEALGCRALIQEGWAGLGSVAMPPGVARIGTCSHAALFPRCAAIVHHGGAGTTTAAARAGVPQLVVAHLADQFYWGRRTAELGLAPPPLRRKTLTAARLATRLAELRDNEIACERARELGVRLSASHPLDEDPARLF